MMSTTVGSLGNRTWEMSFSESSSWLEALTNWKVVHRVQEHTGFVSWTYGLHNLNFTTYLLSCKTYLDISKYSREYNSFCAWAPPLWDRKAPFFTFYQSVSSDSIEWLCCRKGMYAKPDTVLVFGDWLFPFPSNMQLNLCLCWGSTSSVHAQELHTLLGDMV